METADEIVGVTSLTEEHVSVLAEIDEEVAILSVLLTLEVAAVLASCWSSSIAIWVRLTGCQSFLMLSKRKLVTVIRLESETRELR